VEKPQVAKVDKMVDHPNLLSIAEGAVFQVVRGSACRTSWLEATMTRYRRFNIVLTNTNRLSPSSFNRERDVARFLCRFVNVAGAQVAATEVDAFNSAAAMGQARQLAAQCHAAGITSIELFLNGRRVDQQSQPKSAAPPAQASPLSPWLSGAVALTPR